MAMVFLKNDVAVWVLISQISRFCHRGVVAINIEYYALALNLPVQKKLPGFWCRQHAHHGFWMGDPKPDTSAFSSLNGSPLATVTETFFN